MPLAPEGSHVSVDLVDGLHLARRTLTSAFEDVPYSRSDFRLCGEGSPNFISLLRCRANSRV